MSNNVKEPEVGVMTVKVMDEKKLKRKLSAEYKRNVILALTFIIVGIFMTITMFMGWKEIQMYMFNGIAAVLVGVGFYELVDELTNDFRKYDE